MAPVAGDPVDTASGEAWRGVRARYPHRRALTPLGQQRGLTLMEVLVDVSLIATLALSAIVMTSRYLESGRVRTAAEQVTGVFQQARQYAIANAATYTVTLTGTTVGVACTAGCPPNAPGEPPTPITGGATTSVPGSAITFDPMGAATAGTVNVSYPGATQWQVRVTGAGRVRACSPSCPRPSGWPRAR